MLVGLNQISANNAINSDAQELRCAPPLRAGYGERYVSNSGR